MPVRFIFSYHTPFSNAAEKWSVTKYSEVTFKKRAYGMVKGRTNY